MTSEDGTNANATVEELAALAESPQKDVADVTADPKEDPATPEDEPKDDPKDDPKETPKDGEDKPEENADTDALSDADLSLIDKYSTMPEALRNEKLTNMLSSGRGKQAKMLMEALDLEIEEADPIDDSPEAVALKELNPTAEELKEFRQSKETRTRKEAVESWAERLGIDSNTVLKNKEFIKAYHKEEGTIPARSANALKVYLEKNPISGSKKAATLKLSTTGNSTDKPKKKGEVNIEKLLDGKSLEQIDLSQL